MGLDQSLPLCLNSCLSYFKLEKKKIHLQLFKWQSNFADISTINNNNNNVVVVNNKLHMFRTVVVEWAFS